MEKLSTWFWNEGFWLPDGYTWKDLEPTPGVNKPIFTDLYYTPLFAALFLFVRFLFERFIAKPFCYILGVSGNTRTVIEENAICERVFTSLTKRPSSEKVNELVDQLGWSSARVQRWFRKRRKVSDISLIRKATESSWRCVIYSSLFILGSITILPTDWYYDSNEWVKGYMRTQDFNIYLKSYFLAELTFYISLLFSQFIDAKRKDFYQMFLHHVVTISLIVTSYVTNYHRTAAVIMWLHDASDIWLEAAKVFNYAKWQKLCDALFVVFAIVFFITRWIYFPFWVLDAFILKTPMIIGPCNGCHTFLSIKLSILQMLHIYWGVLIARMAYDLTISGKVNKDARSDNESSDDEREVKQANNVSDKKNA